MTKAIRTLRSDNDIDQLPNDAELVTVIDTTNKLINAFNFLNKFLSFQSNFNAYVTSITIPATSTIQVQHFLGVTPKWRIILRQEGNGVITDIPSGWNDTIITLYNNGSVAVTASIMIARE